MNQQRNQETKTMLPSGWEEVADPRSGRKYYANRTTKETRWDPPQVFPASRAAMPAPASVSHSVSTPADTAGGSGTVTDSGNRSNSLFTAPQKNAAPAPASVSHSVSTPADTAGGSGTGFDSGNRSNSLFTAPQKNAAPASVSHSVSTPADTAGGTTSGTGTDSGNRSNSLFTAPPRNAAWNDPGKLIPMAQTILNKYAAFPKLSVNTDMELHSITPGQIADLCHVQHRTKNCGLNIEYTPLNPYRMSTMSAAQESEDGRMDVQIKALKEKLKEIEGESGA